ncbi:C40 family peptidase [Spongiimicrobium salis]|uniref:C40 family peptidase n=1 Tax=Spongiimicrobium salis TaxID=1667022 RepID=UPI00374D1150
MNVKLLFLLVIVFLLSCSRKTFDSVDYAYYKEELTKAKEQEGEKGTTVKQKEIASKEPLYLTTEERKRFADLLGISVTDLENEKLYSTINQWLGVPYLWGGTTKNGIDCSSFVQQVYKDVYEKELPRTSIEQFYVDTKAHFRNQKYLKQGDLIFFRLRHKDKVVSHVGIYLQNGKFLGSNSPRGVEIVDLNSDYWQDKYVASARLLKK